MKISYAIVSTDANPFYADFWKVVSEIWVKRFNIVPVLAFIGDDSFPIDNTYGKVIRIKPIADIPIHLQAQIVRFWVPTLFQDEVSIISDIDMIPISRKYFVEQVRFISDEYYCHLNPCISTYGRLPACYHVAKGSLLKKLLDVDNDWEKFIRKVLSCPIVLKETNQLQEPWFADEIYSSAKVLEVNNSNILKLIERKNGQNGYRIDRLNWKYHKLLLSYDYYFDAHSIRPVSEFCDEIMEMKNAIIESSSRCPPYFIWLFFSLHDTALFFKNYLIGKAKSFVRLFRNRNQ